MEKLKRTAKWLDFLCVALIAATVISVVVATVAQLAAIRAGAVSTSEITIDGIAWTGIVHPAPLIAVGILGTIVVCGICLTGLVLVRNILKPMKTGQPFSGIVTRNLKYLGWLVLGYACLDVLYEFPGKAWLARMAIDGSVDSTVSVSHQANLNLFIVAALLFLFSYIFRYGEELQRLSDETL